MHAGEVCSRCAGVIATAIAQWKPGILGQAREHKNVLTVRRQRRKNARQFEIRAVGSGRPLVHQNAVGNIDEREPHGRAGGGGRCKSRHHGIEQWQRDGCTEASENCPAADAFTHGRPPIMISSTS